MALINGLTVLLEIIWIAGMVLAVRRVPPRPHSTKSLAVSLGTLFRPCQIATALRGRPAAGDRFAEAFEQPFEVRHPLAELADLPALDVDPIAQVAHLAPQGAERRRDRREDRDPGGHDSPRGGVHAAILADAAPSTRSARNRETRWRTAASVRRIPRRKGDRNSRCSSEIVVDRMGFEPTTSALRTRRSPS